MSLKGDLFGDKPYHSRYFFEMVSRKHKNNLKLVEIGVLFGSNALETCTILGKRIQEYFLIDPYVAYDGYSVGTKYPNTQEWYDKIYDDARELLRKEKCVHWIRDTSRNACLKMPDNYFDAVYIDGNHSYKYVKEDIRMWYQKVRIGGWLGGHDFKASVLGVVEAVMELERLGHELYGSDNDWWIVKQ